MIGPKICLQKYSGPYWFPKTFQTLFSPYMLIHLTHKSQTSQRLTAPIFLPTNISEKLKSIQGPVIFIFFIFSISHHFKRFNSHTFFMRTRGKSIYRRYFRWTKFVKSGWPYLYFLFPGHLDFVPANQFLIPGHHIWRERGRDECDEPCAEVIKTRI